MICGTTHTCISTPPLKCQVTQTHTGLILHSRIVMKMRYTVRVIREVLAYGMKHTQARSNDSKVCEKKAPFKLYRWYHSHFMSVYALGVSRYSTCRTYM